MYQESENLMFATDSCTVSRKPSMLQVGMTTGNTQSNLHGQVCFDSERFICMRAKSLQSWWTLCDPMDHSPPDSMDRGENTGVGCHFLLQGIFNSGTEAEAPMSPVLAGRFFATGAKVLSKQPDKQKCNHQENRAPLTRQTAPTVLRKQQELRGDHKAVLPTPPNLTPCSVWSSARCPCPPPGSSLWNPAWREDGLCKCTHPPHPTGSHITPLSAPLPLLRSLPWWSSGQLIHPPRPVLASTPLEGHSPQLYSELCQVPTSMTR